MEQKNQERYKVYLDERNSLVSAERETAQQFDKAILTLAAGALGLSITFINHIAPNPTLQSTKYLISAWVLFSFSILSTLISFLLSQVACRKLRDILDDSLSNRSTTRKLPCSAIITLVLNYFSVVLFVFGVFSLVYFSYLNIYTVAR